MQTQNPLLAVQVTPASARQLPAAAIAANPDAAAQFSQALSREIAQRKSDNAAAPQQQQQPVKQSPAPEQAQQQQQQQAAPADQTSASVPAKPAKSDDASGDGTADAGANAKAADDAATTTPMADMLALVASLNLPPQPAAAPRSAAPADALGVGGARTARAAAAADAASLPTTATVDTDTLGIAGSATPFVDAAATADAAAKAIAAADAAAALSATPAAATTAATNAAAAAALPVAAPALPGTPAVTVDATKGKRSTDAPAIAAATTVVATAAKAVDGASAAVGAAEPKVAAASSTATGAAGDTITDIKPQAADSAATPAAKPQADALPAVAAAPAREAAAAPVALKDVAVAAAPVAAPLQQAALNVAQAVSAAPADKIGARVGSPAWDNQVGQKIVWMVAGKEQSATLTLNPPDMGPMQVVLNVNNDQASVAFTAHQPEVRAALENAMPRLREMMSDNGIALGNATVNAGLPDQQRQAQGDNQTGQHQSSSGTSRGDTVTTINGSASDAAARVAARPARIGGTRSAVDTFA